MSSHQHVCLGCGYNIIGDLPEICPFCNAAHESILPSDQVSARFEVRSTPVSD
jgi:hydroxyacylglutathione hydrolase